MKGKFNSKKKSKRNNNGYFSQNIKKFGKDFIKNKRDDEIKRDISRIFKDVAFSAGQTGSYGEFFLDKRFVTALYQEASSRCMEYEYTSKGLVAYMNEEAKNSSVDPRTEKEISEMIQTKSKLAVAYGIISQGLNNILNTLKIGKQSDRLVLYCKVCMILKQMSMQLKDYRYVL